MSVEELARLAREAGQGSYSPYSKVKVGCALEASDGTIHTGCNIENASFSLTVCAERTALFKGISEGLTRVSRLAVWSNTGLHLYPCGACLQVISEWMDDGDVILVREDGATKVVQLRELFPHNLSDLRDHLT